MNRMTFDFSQKQAYEAMVNMVEYGKLEYEVAGGDGAMKAIPVEDFKAYVDYKVAQLDARAAKSKTKEKAADKYLERVLDAVSDEFETTEQILERVEVDEGDKFTKNMVSARLTKLVEVGKVAKESMSVKVAGEDGKTKTRRLMGYRRV